MSDADASPDTREAPRAQPRWRTVAAPLLTAAYALGCLVLLWRAPMSPLTVSAMLLPWVVFISSSLWRRYGWAVGAVAASVLPVALAWLVMHFGRRTELLYVAEYVLVYASLCGWFAQSLRGTPLITQVARRVHALTPDMEAYTVRLTRAWAIYFAAMASLSLAVFMVLGLKAWAFFSVVLSPASLALFLVGEHFLRYHWHPEFDRASLWQAIRTWREGGA